jgi:hypothetical protein
MASATLNDLALEAMRVVQLYKTQERRIAELEAALRQLLDAVEGAAAHRHVFIPEARAQARSALQKATATERQDRVMELALLAWLDEPDLSNELRLRKAAKAYFGRE